MGKSCGVPVYNIYTVWNINRGRKRIFQIAPIVYYSISKKQLKSDNIRLVYHHYSRTRTLHQHSHALLHSGIVVKHRLRDFFTVTFKVCVCALFSDGFSQFYSYVTCSEMIVYTAFSA